jgi:SH3 domain protein
MTRHLAAGLVVAGALLTLAGSAQAQRAWIKDEVRLNLRTGPGTQFRILGTLVTGDSVEMIARGDGWTQVRAKGGLEGWIPEGFLQEEAPAKILLERHQADTASMRKRFDTLTREVTELRAKNEELEAQQTQRAGDLERLTRENLELRAGARWPHWIAGASILFTGGLIGIIVHWSSSRRTTRRIRL